MKKVSVDIENKLLNTPPPVSERILSPDLARGTMLLLILLAHAPLLLFGTSATGFAFITRPEGATSLDKIINFISYLVVDNRARPMFAVLFGFGMALIVERQLAKGQTVKGTKRLLHRRAWLLILFGFVNSVIIGGHDILAIYGTGALLVGWLLFRSNRMINRTLLALAFFFVFLMPIVWVYFAHAGEPFYHLTAVTSYMDIVQDRFTSFFLTPIAHFLMPILIPILVGVWAARQKLFTDPERHRQLLLSIAVAGITLSFIGALPFAISATFVLDINPTIGGVMYAIHMLTGLAGGCGYAAIFALLGPALNPNKLAVRAIAALGKRSLTFYIYNEAMLVLLLSPVALGLGGLLNSTGITIMAVIIWFSAVCLAFMLEKRSLRGPLETVLRRMINSNRKKPALQQKHG
ncbi:DUF418 domain-containing protein [Salipaludibacillus agaradhaerens]|uniref:DUF418 domain-containing protein n=1 Tax=Salipaludibacillus agaradhaerens TaxID=76935 RepID=UPI0021508479|nr:DUF418 domain-containing protein [Salipaludibacillus agaradhaerens]MCR6104897.1 DUF418 domain-containing protein [Salipaludibacillus agaradhaerens]MCR6116944.1 DUF418 domain-containing protein [Salipaludibacillus agaradhaerens]